MGQSWLDNVPLPGYDWATKNLVPAVDNWWANLPSPGPIATEQAYVPGWLNPDPSVNTNPNPTVAGTVKDLVMVWNDPLATNPVYNATDTPETSPPPSAVGSIPAWLLLIPVGVFAAWVALK